MARAKTGEAGPLGGAVISQQIAAQLLREMRTGPYENCERLPAEVELAARLGVSRTVIRDALAELEREGYVERVRGIGTVVNRRIVALDNRLDQKFEYSAMIRAAGYIPHADSIASGQAQPGQSFTACVQQGQVCLLPGQPEAGAPQPVQV